jgi:hypothetical protein
VKASALPQARKKYNSEAKKETMLDPDLWWSLKAPWKELNFMRQIFESSFSFAYF